ncbi:reactive mitochondrial oxygen species modulator 1-domain-containing protein [Neohortaea acidophila]|uniref:Reactive mitochondrial oxygen species modulator 1-domain-containing protein n=1 Tax=Neohortaea acidophila TaxID=245834 RepID=A0A6A6Q3F5_9PEZI|nr:reactive mitochondrial oxygen species modulator 1-domain-containing protein [Neohortaea acidophila]KAF2485957.1 reactive mitochondrial oxygen species modulator 1-domain-containing protein [Neohortaea acidophila]
MPPVRTSSQPGAVGPAWYDKARMGAMMGGTVGLIIGLIFGATNIIRYGPGPNGMLRTLGQYMLGSAATFGFFMSIGMTIRTDSSPILIEAMQKAQARHGRPVVLPLTRFKKTKAEETQ